MTQRRKTHAVTRHRRRIKGRGLMNWIGKAGSWLNKNIFPMAKTAGKTAFKMYNDPNMRAVANQYAGPRAKKYMSKADEAIKIGNIINGAMGNGRKRRTVRVRQKKSSHRGAGLGMYGRGLGY
jgi:hypothetical protein